MSHLLAHRGPDGEGLWHQEAVGLGHRRVAIVDLTDAARQPMTAEDPRLRVVCNGEHGRGVRGWHDQLWSLLVLDLWHRTFVDRRRDAGSPLDAVGGHGAAVLAS